MQETRPLAAGVQWTEAELAMLGMMLYRRDRGDDEADAGGDSVYAASAWEAAFNRALIGPERFHSGLSTAASLSMTCLLGFFLGHFFAHILFYFVQASEQLGSHGRFWELCVEVVSRFVACDQ